MSLNTLHMSISNIVESGVKRHKPNHKPSISHLATYYICMSFTVSKLTNESLRVKCNAFLYSVLKSSEYSLFMSTVYTFNNFDAIEKYLNFQKNEKSFKTSKR